MRWDGGSPGAPCCARPKRGLKWALLLGAALAFAAPALAAEADEDAWMWSDPDEWFFFDEDSLFGSGDLLTEAQVEPGGALEEAFLVSGADFGGTYRFATEAEWRWIPGEGGPADAKTDRRADLGGSLFLDARPSRDFRAFAKVKGDALLTKSPIKPDIRLHELFADVSLGSRAFLRAGKQTVNWGVGYFFSPADIINIGRIDPENPEAEREGPVAVRLHLPSGRNNLYAYGIADGKEGGYRLALAPKAEFVLGRSEVGAGLYYRSDRAPRAMATLSTAYGRFSLFGEAVLTKGSDKRFVEEAPISPEHPFGLKVVTDRETLRFHATAGARLTHSDPDGRFSVTGAGQYYYNGEGYDGEFSKKYLPAMWSLVEDEELAATDIIPLGRHYAAFSLSGTSRAFKNLAPSAFWLGNLSDGSGAVSLSLGYTGWKDVRPSIGISHMYGEAGSEHATLNPVTTLTVGVTIGGSW